MIFNVFSLSGRNMGERAGEASVNAGCLFAAFHKKTSF